MLFTGSQRQDGSYPVSVRITKDRESKFIITGLSAAKEQWNEAS
ncbi:Arm DNA-binding domain-containing protein [Macellibacteroides fermentans]